MVSYQSDKEEGKRYKSDSSFQRRTFRRHLLDADDFVAQLLEGHSNVFRRGVNLQVPYKSFYRFVSFGVESEEWETFLTSEFLYGFVLVAFVCDPCTGCSIPGRRTPPSQQPSSLSEG
jgi:hypothetical protein